LRFDPIERARIKKHIVIILMALGILLFARPIVNYLTGGVLDNPPQGLKTLSDFFDKAIKLAQFIGGFIGVLMLMWNAIRLKTTE